MTIDVAADLPPAAQGRSFHFEQALLNLVVNASEAMGGKGDLAIAARIARPAAGSLPVLRLASLPPKRRATS
ncbi:MAG: hypothetical protein R3F11_14545 [Verrucomicrobiales bacterium]